jgi:LmbE family N-acetylglucosaminyl deacetylase
VHSAQRVGAALLWSLAVSILPVPGRARAQTAGQTPPPVPLAPAYGRGGVALAEQVAGLGNTVRVLMIAAHPDDEDTRLLTWLARGRHVETAYLSLTRGDGGQNLIGNELGEALGVIRTEELLAARRLDGAHQYFTRAYDFGFSKSAEETFTHWPHDSLLTDVVTVVRAFRPHVIIAVFTGTPRDGHGQHQVSAILAREAYDVSGDTQRFPEGRYGPAWTASKFYRDRSYFGGGENTIPIDVGAYDPLLGVTYPEIATLSRSQHRSQGFGNVPPTGPVTGYVYREATRVNESTPVGHERSMFDGVDTTFGRLAPAMRGRPAARAALDSLAPLIARIQARFRATAPAQALEPLAELRDLEQTMVPSQVSWSLPRPHATTRSREGDGSGRSVPDLDADLARTLDVALARVSRALVLASATRADATVAHDVATDRVRVATSLANRGSRPVEVRGERSSGEGVVLELRGGPSSGQAVLPDSTWRDTIALADTVLSQPWWLRTPRRGDLFSQPVAWVAEDERPQPGLVLDFGARLPAGGTAFTTEPVPAVQRIADPTRGEVDRPLAFVPLVSLTLDQTVEYVPARAQIDRPVRVLLRSGADTARDVTVSLQLPQGLTADSSARRVTLPGYGTRRIDFRIEGALPAGQATLSATAETNGETFRSGYVPIEYEHIRPQKLYRPSELRLSVADIVVPAGLTVGYIPGVGDNVEPMLEQLGLRVSVLDPASLPTADLSRFTTIVVGPRAYEANADLRANNGRLLDFARNGGTLVVQYGQYEMTEPGMMPYPITLNRPHDRVTDENAPVRVLDPQSPVLTVPNKITDADFAGWVQERSLYMPHTFDPHYHAVLSMNDPGEPPNDGAVLVAPLGKGTYVYTSLAFFRQLPAGVPGAARLFVNLLQAGRRCCDAM